MTEDAPAVRRLWKGGVRSTGPARLSRLGWDITIYDRAALAEAYGRTSETGEQIPAGGGGYLTGVAR
jgi:hypothetical protein